MSPSPVPDANRVARISFECFEQLPKSGRPQPAKEWTVLSTILKYKPATDELEVVSLGTGTKCLSQDLLSTMGDRLNDSHAEVMARRGFLRYLLHEMHQTKSEDSVFQYDESELRFRLRDGVGFHFFSTHPPCGDASIFKSVLVGSVEDRDVNGPSDPKKRKICNDSEADQPDLGEILRGFTGGKLLQSAALDADPDPMAQRPGAIRTKPGRGIRTLSVSCSDKLSRWSLVGVQGALLHSILAADSSIYLKSITLAGVADVSALERAIWRRWESSTITDNIDGIRLEVPVIQKTGSQCVFAHAQNEGLQPTPASIVWCKVPHKNFEVAVSGKRQGVTKKKLATPIGRLQICKIELLRQFEQLVLQDFPEIGAGLNISLESTYGEAKKISRIYTNACAILKGSYFQCWTTKPENINYFTCD